MNVARNYSLIMGWTYETLARLRYGVFFTDCLVDFGEDFYLEGENELMDSYAYAKEKGVNSLILEGINEKILDVAYRHRTKDRDRADVYKYLDPLPELSVAEAKDLIQSGAVSVEELKIKVNLLKYIRKFEMEFGDMVDFMPNNFQKKIEFINLKFEEYATSKNDSVQPELGV